MNPLTVVVESTDGATIVRMNGWAGIDALATLEREVTRLSAGKHPLLVLDLTGLTGLGSLGVSQFVLLHRAVRHHEGQLRVGGCNDEVRGVLVRCKIDSLIPLHGSVEEALSAARSG